MENFVFDVEKLKRCCIFLAVLIVGSVAVFFLVFNPLLGDDAKGLEYKVTIDVVTPTSETFTLYYDNLDSTRFDSAHTVTASVKGSTSFQSVSFMIPAESVRYLKFSLASQNNTTFFIRSISADSFSRTRKITYDKLAEVFDITEKMSRFSDKDGYISTKSTKIGSYFANSEPLEITYGKPTLPLMSASVTLMIMCSVLLIIKAVKSGDKKPFKSPDILLVVAFAVACAAFLIFGLAISPISPVADYIFKAALGLIIFIVCAIIIITRLRKAEKKPELIEAATVICLGFVFCSALISSIFFLPDTSDDEYTVPDFTVQRFMMYADEITLQYEKQAPITTLLSDTYADMKTYVFADSRYEDVVIGKNGWLFSSDELADYKRTNTFAKESLVKIRDTLLNYERTFKGQDIAFYVLIVPDKSAVYENMMPSSVRRTAREDRLTQVYDYLWKYSDMNIVEIRDQLISASYDNDVYYRTDNYLNSNGCFITVNALLTKLAAISEGIEQLDIDDYEIEPIESQMKSLAMLMQRGDTYKEYDINYRIKRKQNTAVTSAQNSPFMSLGENEALKVPDINALFGEGAIAQLTADDTIYLTDNYINIKNTSAVNDLHAVVIHDEALLTAIPYIAHAFTETSFILNNGDWTSRSIIDEGPDIVIYEISEKYLASLVK